MGLFKSVASAIGGSVLNKTLDSIFANSANAKAKRAATIANDRNVYNMQHQYQWTMDDSKAAGFNPILAAQNGANNVNSASTAQTMKAEGTNIAEMANAIGNYAANSANAQLATVKAAGQAIENGWVNKREGQNIKESISRTIKNDQERLESQSRIGLNSAKKMESRQRTRNLKGTKEGALGYGAEIAGKGWDYLLKSFK